MHWRWGDMGRLKGYTSRGVAKAVIWADYEGSTWSQLRARNAKVLYISMRRMGPDTAPAKRLRKQGHNNVLADCFMKGLNFVADQGYKVTFGDIECFELLS